MKVQDFAYQVSKRTMDMLEEQQHYKVSEEHRKDILKQILDELDALIKKAS
jgi:hypothetical protein